MSRALTRSSLLHFLLLGALLFGLRSGERQSDATDLTVHLTGAEISQLELQWARTAGRPPTPPEREALLQQHVDEKILLAEAFAQGWNRSDPVARQRLLRNLRFLDQRGDMSDEALLEEAWALGMDRSDLVVQRRLIDRMRRTLTAHVYANEPTDAELEEFLARHSERFTTPPLVSLSHVFLSRDERGERITADAEALLAHLRKEGALPESAIEWGDPFLLEKHLPLSTHARLSAQLGPEFADAAFLAPTGRWSGPIRSAYGTHLLWVRDRTEPHPPSLSSQRHRVRAELLAERERAAYAQAITNLRERTSVSIAGDTELSP